MANFYLAFEADLTIVPVMNKIDMANADPDRVSKEMKHLFDFKDEEIIRASAKMGIGINEILDGIIERIPAPEGSVTSTFKALLFDSRFDAYKGVICLIAIKDGASKKETGLRLRKQEQIMKCLNWGSCILTKRPWKTLYAGQVGYIICGMKTVHEARVGETIYFIKSRSFLFLVLSRAKPMVFAGIFPIDNEEFEFLETPLKN